MARVRVSVRVTDKVRVVVTVIATLGLRFELGLGS